MPCGANDERPQRVIAEKKLLRVCKPRFSPVAHKMQKLTPPVRDNLARRKLAVSFTTSVEALTGAFASLMRPLRAIRVPVDDVATMLSLAVRFIPLTAEELALVRSAQTARGARLESGSIWQRLFAYRTVFIPLVVRLFRRADTLSVSMVARCYGCTQRTSLEEPHVCLRQAVVFLACSALLVVVACIL